MNRRNARRDSAPRKVRNLFISEVDHLALTYKSVLNTKLTSYGRTVRNLENAFSHEELYFGIYENMFIDKNIGELSEFLGVKISIDSALRRENPTKKLKCLPEGLERRIASYYEDVYRFCGTRFPETLDLWNGFRFIT